MTVEFFTPTLSWVLPNVSGKMTHGHKLPPPQSSRDGMYERRAFLERCITPNEHLNISTLLLLS